MSRIYLARHGETEWNAIGKLQGATDVPLNEVGRAQARRLGELLRDEVIDGVTTSDLSRARETGTIAGDVLGTTTFEADADLRERGFGIFEGLTRAECDASFPEAWRDWQARAIAPPGAEPIDRVVARMNRAIARIALRPGPTLVVSHGGAMRLLLTELTGQPVLPIGNGAIYRIDFDSDRFDVQSWAPHEGSAK